MQTSDFDYELPPELIAQRPLAERSASRLLVLDGTSGRIEDRRMRELPSLLARGDLLVFNDTRVIPARLFAVKPSGGRVELLVERLTGERRAWMHARASHPLRVEQRLAVEGGGTLRVCGGGDGFYELESEDEPILALLDRAGHVPLPPYIRRPDEGADRERYQSVFARVPGAVAAPTASLHFDAALLAAFTERGIETARVTLHVGAGTFKPVREDDPAVHLLHHEWCEVPAAAISAITDARARGARVIAVGTTVVRSLETAARTGTLASYVGETGLYILPGYRFRIVDALVTNFHLPRSTLLMLVCAVAGRERMLAAYRHAVAENYRFYSYGDAMFMSLDPEARG